MPEYVCRYANDRGQVLRQVEKAASEGELRDRYVQQGFHIYSIQLRPGLAGLFQPGPAAKKIKLSEFLVFNQQFVTLIRAGLPIVKALDLLSSHITKPALRSRLAEIRERVKGGALLSEAVRAQGVFPEVYTTSLLAGEKSGNLEEVLIRYVSYQRTALSVKKKLAASLVYPAILIAVVLVLLTILVTYVIPNFADLYRTISQELPVSTQYLIAFTDTFRQYWLLLMALLAAAGIGLWSWSRSQQGGEALDRLKMQLPVAGEIWSKYQVAQFSRILGTLLSGGIPLVQALETARDSVTSPLLRHSLDTAARRIREGNTLWESLSETKFFPPLAIEMVEVGESSGALPAMLSSVADFFDEDVDTYMAAVLSAIEPGILIFMGSIVLFVLWALYMPIFSLASKIR
ncbi:MAG TPA: type II secretion system F family protein [Gemmatimonadales bacterium]|nr:type II secretion system F family protein [Gemmatimonadales bacterium]